MYACITFIRDILMKYFLSGTVMIQTLMWIILLYIVAMDGS